MTSLKEKKKKVVCVRMRMIACLFVFYCVEQVPSGKTW